MTDKIRQLGREKVRKGKSKIPLKIPDDVPRGEYPLHIEYEENEKYTKSDAYGTLRHYHKVWIHLPTIYVYKQYEDTANIKVNLFADNSPVNHGRGKFKVQNVTVSPELQVKNGKANYEYNITPYRNGPRTKLDTMFTYGGSSEYLLSPGRGEGKIAFLECHKGGIPLQMHTYPLIAYTGEKVMLVSRIYKLQHSNAINDIDIPDEGSIRWIINGKIVGTSTILESGYSLLEYTVTENEGIYEITAEYIPQKDSEKYCIPLTAETLYVQRENIGLSHATANIPPQKLGTTCTFTAHFTNIENIDTVQLFIDDQLCHLTSVNNSEYKQKVTNEDTIFSFIIPEEPTATKLWAYPGTHIIRWGYVHKELGVYLEEYMTSFIITHPTHIHFDDIGRDEDYNVIYNGLKGVPIVLPDVEGNVVYTNFPEKLVNEGNLTLIIDKMTPVLNLIRADLTLKVDDYGRYICHLESNTTVDMPNRTIKFLKEEETLTQQTDESGNTEFNTQFTNAGIIPCTITYSGNDYEERVEQNINVTVLKRPTILELTTDANWRKETNNLLYVEDSVTIKVQLNEDIGDAVPYKTVTIYDNNNPGWSQTVTTNNKGTATKTIQISEKRSLDLYAIFEEDYKYLSSRGIGDRLIVVTKYTPQITTTTTDVNVDDNISIQLTVNDDLGNPIQGLTINKLESGNTQSIGTTDNKGQITYTEHATKKGQMTFTFNNTETYKYFKSSKTQIVNISALPLTCQITGNTNSIGLNPETYICQLNILKHEQEVPLTNIPVTITINPSEIIPENLVTDMNGEITWTQIFEKSGLHTITVTIPETDEYDQFSTTIDVNCNTAEPQIIGSYESIQDVLETQTLSFTVMDKLTKTLLQNIPVTISVYYEETEIIIGREILTDNSGNVTCTFNPQDFIKEYGSTPPYVNLDVVITGRGTHVVGVFAENFGRIYLGKITITPSVTFVTKENQILITYFKYTFTHSTLNNEFISEHPPTGNWAVRMTNVNVNVLETQTFNNIPNNCTWRNLPETQYLVSIIYQGDNMYNNLYYTALIDVKYPKIIDECNTTENWIVPVGAVPKYNNTLLDNQTVFMPFPNYWDVTFWKYPLYWRGGSTTLEFDVYMTGLNNWFGLISLKRPNETFGIEPEYDRFGLDPFIKVTPDRIQVKYLFNQTNLNDFIAEEWNHIKITSDEETITIQFNESDEIPINVDEAYVPDDELYDYIFLAGYSSNDSYPIYFDNIQLTNDTLNDGELTSLFERYISQYSENANYPENNLICTGLFTGSDHNIADWINDSNNSTALPYVEDNILVIRNCGNWWTKVPLSHNCVIYVLIKVEDDTDYEIGIESLNQENYMKFIKDEILSDIGITTPYRASASGNMAATSFEEYAPFRIIILDNTVTFETSEFAYTLEKQDLFPEQQYSNETFYFYIRKKNNKKIYIKSIYYIDYE